MKRLEILPPDELGRASLGGGSYRIATPSRDELWSTVENGSSAHESRILASRAIAATFVPGERDRLAKVLAETLDPRVRIALKDALASRGSEEMETDDESEARVRHR